jgi:hypothetical protein
LTCTGGSPSNATICENSRKKFDVRIIYHKKKYLALNFITKNEARFTEKTKQMAIHRKNNRTDSVPDAVAKK